MKTFLLATLVCALAVTFGTVIALPWSEAFASGEGQAYCAGRGDVHFRATDRTRLIGHRFGRGTTAVVLAHESRSSLCAWIPYARRLASKGYLAFAFDFRNNGLSQEVGYRRSGRFAGDVAAAARYVRAHGAKKVFLVGASMGGTAVLVGGANVRPDVNGVVSLSGPSSFGPMEAAPAVPRLRVPVLYLVARDDTAGAYATDAQALYAATASSDKAIEILGGTDHGVSLVGYPGKARELLEQFLGVALMRPDVSAGRGQRAGAVSSDTALNGLASGCDEIRPLIEFYRHGDEIDLLVPARA